MVLLVTEPIVTLVVFVIVATMVFVTLREILRSSSAKREEHPSAPPAHYISSSSDPAPYFAQSLPLPAPATTTADIETEPVDMTLYDPEAYDERPRTNLAIARYNFRGFDAETSPPDRDCFYDEIMVEVFDHETGARWHTRYFVATPAGLAKLMRDEHWDSMFGNNHIIVARYDVQNILEAILRQLNNAWEAPSEQPEPDPRG